LMVDDVVYELHSVSVLVIDAQFRGNDFEVV
jgi:hypothetical protein